MREAQESQALLRKKESDARLQRVYETQLLSYLEDDFASLTV